MGAQLPQARLGVAGGGVRERGGQVDHEGAFGLRRETGADQVVRPAGVGRPLEGVVESGLQARPARPAVLGQEAWEEVHLGDGQEAARPQGVEHVGQHPVRVGQVVECGGGPDEVAGGEGRPALVQIGLYTADPVRESQPGRLHRQAVQHLRGDVHRRDLGSGEAPRQGDRTGPGSAAQIDDADRFPVGQFTQPGGQLRQVRPQDLCVELQDLGHDGGGGGCVRAG